MTAVVDTEFYRRKCYQKSYIKVVHHQKTTMDEYVAYASSLPPSGQLPTLTFIALILGLGKGGVPGLGEIILLYI